MDISGQVALVSGGASGLGLATVEQLVRRGVRVVVLDLPVSKGADVAARLGTGVVFVPGDVTSPEDVARAVATTEELGSLRVLVHTAGVGGPLRIVDRKGNPGSLETFERVLWINVIGTYTVLSQAAACMARQEPLGEERGVCLLTASIAAYDGRIGQVHYAASKGGVVSMTLPAARDLSSKLIRVVTIAPGVVDTPLLGKLPDDVRAGLAADVPHPRRLAMPDEYASLALHVIDNPMLNGEVIRLDGALRMSPR